MSELLLQAQPREKTGKGFAKKLRREGKIPGIFYSHGEKAIPIALDQRETLKILGSESGLIDFQLGKKRKQKAIIKDVQVDPVKQTLVHIDVQGVSLEEKITINVPIVLVGEAIGVKQQGGILHQYLRELEVECLPLDIPDRIEIDVTKLNIGDTITARSLSIEKATIVGDLDQPIVNVLPPTVEKEVKPEVVEAAAEAEKAPVTEKKEE
ncbi:MAG: 50S ribosomal protein L25 [candidate division KSB1 bacterium]|nr:50S ribosomal protein L25 [candidate division KSB1 bacterium]MDZ7335884.1 50S ribosomal protein L25 [candidate division KSB1 bacterium]MDZ7356680.1 50S ribosomal protein L25 [candidate division KSB1 bacterium]MDZ7377092.1 50S ribosomal protein L25 [candidate division KSB1 bacterium]MDZ7398557.1 50S ribosomal protein L25 [candidate division KSB1 bacterium]